MKQHPLTSQHWHMVALAALLVGLFFVMPFMGIIALSALMAFLFHGFYLRLRRRLARGTAGVVTVIVSILVVVVPVTLIVAFTAVQLTQLATELSSSVVSEGSGWNVPAVLHSINSFVASIAGSGQLVSVDGVMEFLRNTLPTVLRGIATVMTNVIGGIPLAIILGIMYIILLYEFLVYGKDIVRNIIKLSPFPPEVTTLYLERVGLMANAMAKGQLYISFVISLCSAVILTVCLGLGKYFFLMTIVFTLLNLIPLGCGIVVIPITIIAMLSGQLWPGLLALVLYIIVSNLDAVIRPRIIPKSITLSPGITMLAAFGGIAMFGLMGVVYGPILMIVVVTAIQVYLENYTAPRVRKRSQVS